MQTESIRVGGSFYAHKDNAGNGQLLLDHLLSVSRLTRANAAKFGLGDAGALIGLLHDLGKYSSAFQEYLHLVSNEPDPKRRDAERGSVDHSTAGAQTIWQSWKDQSRSAQCFAEFLALCIASHHSGLIDCVKPGGTHGLATRLAKSDADSHQSEAWRNAEPELREAAVALLRQPSLTDAIHTRISAIVVGESEEPLRRFKIGLLLRMLFSALIDADRTDTAASASPFEARARSLGRYLPWTTLIDRAEQDIAARKLGSPIGALRARISDACLAAAFRPKGLFSLTVPTGGGKTLSSLRFALHHAERHKLDRIIYVSPYTSIIDQNADVVRRVLETPADPFASVVLEHHGNLDPECQTSRSKLLSENWDAPVVFTTSVQFLEALFGSGTRAVRRLHQLANAVIIFDEVQTIPVRCIHLFNNALNFLVDHCGSSAVLCTATQPLLHRVDPVKGALRLTENSEIVPDIAGLFRAMSRTTVLDRRKPGGWEHSEVAQLARTECDAAGSCLIVVNTKAEALSIFDECRKLADGAPVFHLSTSMCAVHRMVVLDEIVQRLRLRQPLICVSTQLIEAGVDISFGAAIRALAGLSSVAQTAGRCNRHGEAAVGRVHVVNLRGKLTAALSEIKAGQEACQRVFDESRTAAAEDLCGPFHMERFFQYYFLDRKAEMDYPVGPAQAERDDTLLRLFSDNALAISPDNPPPTFFRQAFMTASEAFQAIDSNTRGVIVPYGEAGRKLIADLSASFEPQRNFALLRQAQRFSVNLFPHQLRALEQANALYSAGDETGILFLHERYYSDVSGVTFAGNEEMEFNLV